MKRSGVRFPLAPPHEVSRHRSYGVATHCSSVDREHGSKRRQRVLCGCDSQTSNASTGAQALSASLRGVTEIEYRVEVRRHQCHLLIEVRFADCFHSLLATPRCPFGLPDPPAADDVWRNGFEGDAAGAGNGQSGAVRRARFVPAEARARSDLRWRHPTPRCALPGPDRGAIPAGAGSDTPASAHLSQPSCPRRVRRIGRGGTPHLPHSRQRRHSLKNGRIRARQPSGDLHGPSRLPAATQPLL